MSGGNLRWMGRLDMYRKVPTDLLEGTKRGSILSILASLVMVTLFLFETTAYFRKTLVTDLQLDSNDETRVRLNFNITMMDLKCEYVVVDVISVLGTEQNVSNHITKWHVDGNGIRQRYQGRNKQQRDLHLYDTSVTMSLDELHINGEDAIQLSEETFEYAKKQQEYLFVDFYASWCSHCRDLHPTWETLAELMTDVAEHIILSKEDAENAHTYNEEEYGHAIKVELPVMVAKVDCVQHQQFCRSQMIMAYPTLRLFVDGERWRGGDYRGHRTVVDMADYLKQVEDLHKTDTNSNKAKNVELVHLAAQERVMVEGESNEEHEWEAEVKRQRQRLHHSWVDEDHPGCQVSGHLLLDRVPGNFHIQARSPHHDLVPHLTNVSHVIHSLTFGEPIVKSLLKRGVSSGKFLVPDDLQYKMASMDGNTYITYDLHEAYHHYLKVVTTNVPGLIMGNRELKAYQIIQNSQLSMYRPDVVPEAKFIYDLSPIAVHYKGSGRHWYDYITSIMAITGGTFTVVGMLEATIARTVSTSRRRY